MERSYELNKATEAHWGVERQKAGVKLAIVVPVLNEYANGNVIRLIESFTKQTVPLDSFELVLVVNNSWQSAQVEDNIYRDNRQTLAIREFLNNQTPLPEGLNNYRQNVLISAKRKGLTIYMLDSTRGMERNMGKIRDKGLWTAIGRLRSAGKGAGAIIAMMDADTVVRSDYAENIFKHFANPGLDSLFLGLDYAIPEGTNEVFKSTWAEQFKRAWVQWVNLFGNNFDFSVGGPQIVARLGSYEKIGGIPFLDINEDYRLARELRMQTNAQFATDVTVYASDRKRSEGFDASVRTTSREMPETLRYTNFMRKVFLMDLAKTLSSDQNQPANEDTLKKVFDRYTVPFNHEFYVQFSSELKNLVNIKDNHPNSLLSILEFRTPSLKPMFEYAGMPDMVDTAELIQDCLALIRQSLTSDEVNILDLITEKHKHTSQLRIAIQKAAIQKAISIVFEKNTVSAEDISFNPKTGEFLERNPWMINEINQLRGTCNSETEALTRVLEEYPDFFGEYNESSFRKMTQDLRALTNFAQQAIDDPARFPGFTSFRQRIIW